jgi:hypothetical protein
VPADFISEARSSSKVLGDADSFANSYLSGSSVVATAVARHPRRWSGRRWRIANPSSQGLDLKLQSLDLGVGLLGLPQGVLPRCILTDKCSSK